MHRLHFYVTRQRAFRFASCNNQMESFTVDLFGPNSRSVVVISGLDYIVVVLAAATNAHNIAAVGVPNYLNT